MKKSPRFSLGGYVSLADGRESVMMYLIENYTYYRRLLETVTQR